MGRSREYPCIHYVCEGQCDLGKDGSFKKHCQICKTYKKKPGSIPARKDTRRERTEKILRREYKNESN